MKLFYVIHVSKVLFDVRFRVRLQSLRTLSFVFFSIIFSVTFARLEKSDIVHRKYLFDKKEKNISTFDQQFWKNEQWYQREMFALTSVLLVKT